MENILITLLNLSITASYVIIAVILLRYVLFKAPKWISCLLWAVVGIRLAFPFSIESMLSLIPSAKPIPEDIAMSREPQIDTGLDFVNSAVNPVISGSFTPDPVQSANPLQIWLPIASIIWIAGLCAILLWGMISYILVRRKTIPYINIRDNIYICDNIFSPFILGMLRPKIYLPSAISGEESAVVIEHEKAHISRLDHIWKPIGFVLLAVYWFNPLVWLAYALLCRDIEKACDQKVIKKMSDDSRRIYSQTLLSYSANSVRISACPLAFGEVGVKTRIKSILNYKKPAFWIIIVAIVLLIATAVVFLTYPKAESEEGGGNDLEVTTELQESKITEDMVPSPAELSGMGNGKLFVEIDGETYRYSRTDESPSQYTRGDELLSFTYKPPYYTSQYEPDTITVYKLVGVDLNKLLVWYNNGQSDSRTYIYEYAPPQACAPDALENAKRDGYTVTEGLFVTHGADEFHDYYEKTSNGIPAELKLAKYYTLTGNMIDELYEATKEDYPQIYYLYINYDGTKFTFELDNGQLKDYTYIHKFTDIFPETSLYPGKTYNVYALSNVKDLTWDQIRISSSDSRENIDHYKLIFEFVEE